jgi:hypothetical protein
MILWYDHELRGAHAAVWGKLFDAWRNTFHSELSLSDLETWPTTGAHAFNQEQCEWLTETLRHLKMPAGKATGPALRSRVVRAANPEPAPGTPARKSKAVVSAGKKRRASYPVEDSRRWLLFP